jgi:hypothetical protein
MNTKLQVTFRHMPVSQSVEARIGELVEELEASCPRMTSCRVLVDAPSAHHRHGAAYGIRIEIELSGSRIVAGGPPATHEHDDVYVALGEAFRAARRRVEDHLGRTRELVEDPAGHRGA